MYMYMYTLTFYRVTVRKMHIVSYMPGPGAEIVDELRDQKQ